MSVGHHYRFWLDVISKERKKQTNRTKKEYSLILPNKLLRIKMQKCRKMLSARTLCIINPACSLGKLNK